MPSLYRFKPLRNEAEIDRGARPFYDKLQMTKQNNQELSTLIFDLPNKHGAPVPMKWMIVLHGQGDQKESYKEFARELNITGVRFLLVDAPIKTAYGNWWYDPDPSQQEADVLLASKRIAKLVEELVKRENLSYDDLILFGFSAGGRIALAASMMLSKKLAAVVALSPRFVIPEELLKNPSQQTPYFITHGLYDEVIPHQQTLEASKCLAEKENVVFKSYPMGHEICLEEVVDLRDWLNSIL